jgi:hypothetical protein
VSPTWPSFPMLWPGNSQSSNLEQSHNLPHLFSLSGSMVFYCLMSSVLKIISCILSTLLLVVFGWRVNLVPIIFSLETEVGHII